LKSERFLEVKTYLDSSAYAKRFVEEDGSEVVDAVCGEASMLVLSVLCLPEIVSAFNRRLREKKLTRRGYELLKKRLAEEIKDAWIVNLTPGVIEVSVSLLEKNSLRAFDAIHIACAVECKADLFVSADRNQLSAAQKSGLKILSVA
jgi:predicted nucleic acid-binding protein